MQSRLWGPWEQVQLQKQGNLMYVNVSWGKGDTGREEVLTVLLLSDYYCTPCEKSLVRWFFAQCLLLNLFKYDLIVIPNLTCNDMICYRHGYNTLGDETKAALVQIALKFPKYCTVCIG